MQYRRSDITGVLAVIGWLYYKVIYYYIVSKFFVAKQSALVYLEQIYDKLPNLSIESRFMK
jgi:hypothetical protein